MQRSSELPSGNISNFRCKTVYMLVFNAIILWALSRIKFLGAWPPCYGVFRPEFTPPNFPTPCWMRLRFLIWRWRRRESQRTCTAGAALTRRRSGLRSSGGTTRWRLGCVSLMRWLLRFWCCCTTWLSISCLVRWLAIVSNLGALSQSNKALKHQHHRNTDSHSEQQMKMSSQ